MSSANLSNPNCQKLMTIQEAARVFRAVKGDTYEQRKVTTEDAAGLNFDATTFSGFIEDNKETLALYESQGGSL